jgi:hypothetical protein
MTDVGWSRPEREAESQGYARLVTHSVMRLNEDAKQSSASTASVEARPQAAVMNHERVKERV